MIRTATVTASISRSAGGLFESVRRLSQEVAGRREFSVSVLGLEDQFTSADAPSWRPIEATAFPVIGPRSYGWSPALGRALDRGDFELVHLHGVWMYPTVATRHWASKTGQPYLVSAHGMLDPWALGQSRAKKWIAMNVYQWRTLAGAACIRTLCASETRAVRALGLANPICEIPNGVEIASSSLSLPPSAPVPRSTPNVLLFLGRLHHKKGLHLLIPAWAAAQRRNQAAGEMWSLSIVGWGSPRYKAELETLARELNAPNVFLSGPVFGAARDAAYAGASAVVLPSFSEGLPVAVLEAWSHGKPALITDECNLPEGCAAGAALSMRPSVESITEALLTLWSMSDVERRAMGARARDLAARRFCWADIGAEIRRVYQWLLGAAPRPGSIV